jgi:N-acetyl-alpha-D-muramate 1-phosphate uridylyltransferase
MEAMIFAAGLGTRLGHLTAQMPKALVPVAGIPILERVARRLIDAGVDRIVINIHHFADRIQEYVRSREAFGIEVVFSLESDQPLETGGGLKAAAGLLRGDAPFFIHNADVLSEIPLETMYRQHLERGPLATLAVMSRSSSRQLLFDDAGLLGRTDSGKGLRIEARPPIGEVRERAFAGIHVVDPELPGLITEEGVFSILEPYLRLAREGQRIEGFETDAFPWMDVGKPEQLAAAERMFATSEG